MPASRSCGCERRHRYRPQGSGHCGTGTRKASRSGGWMPWANARPWEVLPQRTGKTCHPSHHHYFVCARLPSASQLPAAAGVNPSETTH